MRHRKPPVPHWHKGRGWCRWCGEAVEGGKGRWHHQCVTAYKIAAWGAEARRAVWERDKGMCGGCGKDVAEMIQKAEEEIRQSDRYRELAGDRISLRKLCRIKSGDFWQADHIRPLIEANGDLSYWDLANIRILCTACHNRETAALAKRRAAARRPANPQPDWFPIS